MFVDETVEINIVRVFVETFRSRLQSLMKIKLVEVFGFLDESSTASEGKLNFNLQANGVRLVVQWKFIEFASFPTAIFTTRK